jgi:hypothetical protein
MDNQLVYKFVEETRQQCRFSSLAFQNIRSSLNALDSEKTFYHVDAFLYHAHNLSRLFWPEREASRPRGERLRTELKVTDESPLKMLEFRRHVENFDERLEDWLTPLENRNYIEMNVMPQGTLGDFKPDKFHRSLDPETFQFHFRGDPCNLRQVADEIRKLETTIQSWFRTHSTW